MCYTDCYCVFVLPWLLDAVSFLSVCPCIMVILRSGSITADDSINMAEMTSEQFALFLVKACKQPDIRKMIADIASPKDEQFSDAVSAEVHRQMPPLKNQLSGKDAELQRLRNVIRDQQMMLDDLEQHGRRDSLRITGVPENPEHHNTDEAILIHSLSLSLSLSLSHLWNCLHLGRWLRRNALCNAHTITGSFPIKFLLVWSILYTSLDLW